MMRFWSRAIGTASRRGRRLSALLGIIALTCFLSAAISRFCSAQQATNVSQRIDPSIVKQKLHTILSRTEFTEHSARENGFFTSIQDYIQKVQTAFTEFVRWIEKWYERIKEIFSFGSGAIASTSNIFVWLFIAACIVAAIYLLLKYISVIRSSRAAAAPRRPLSSAISESEFDVALARSVEEWLADAMRLATQHNYRAAIRARFLAILLQLDAAGLLEYNRTETNGDYELRLATISSSDIASSFRRLVRDFDMLWYGEHDATSVDDERSAKDCDVIADALERNRGPKADKAHALAPG